MNPSKILLIDINGIGYASMYTPSFARLTHDGEPTGAIHGTVNSVINICENHPDAVPVVLWDGHSDWRRALHPDYKANRTDDEKKVAIKTAYKKQIPAIRALLDAFGICQITSATWEADDIAGRIVRNTPEDVEITLVSDDTDWWQSLRHNVVWFAPRNNRILHLADLNDPVKCDDGPFASIDEYIMAKSMAGDSSDNINGVPGIGTKTAAKILREHGSFEALWAKADAGEPIKGVALQKVAGKEYRELYARNLKLIDWRRSPDIPNDLSITAPARDMTAFRELAAAKDLKKIVYVAEAAKPAWDNTDLIRMVLQTTGGYWKTVIDVSTGIAPALSSSARETTPSHISADGENVTPQQTVLQSKLGDDKTTKDIPARTLGAPVPPSPSIQTGLFADLAPANPTANTPVKPSTPPRPSETSEVSIAKGGITKTATKISTTSKSTPANTATTEAKDAETGALGDGAKLGKTNKAEPIGSEVYDTDSYRTVRQKFPF